MLNGDIGLAFFVFKRPEHTKKVLKSIEKCGFKKIYIFQDGIRKEEDRIGWNEVNELINNISFAETELIVSPTNKGLAQSIMDGMEYVFKKHNYAIALEDDIVLYPGYKDYMEFCFEKYSENKRVMSISGGGYGAIIPNDYHYDLVFTYRMSSVAFGTWKDRWIGFSRDPRLLDEIVADPRKNTFFRNAGGDIKGLIMSNEAGKASTWAAFWTLHQVNNLGFHIYPTIIFAEDIGRDGTGTNSDVSTNRYDQIGEKGQGFSANFNAPNDVVVDDRIVEDTKDLTSIEDDRAYKLLKIKIVFRAFLFRRKYKEYFEKHEGVWVWINPNDQVFIWILKKIIQIKGLIYENPAFTEIYGLNILNIFNERPNDGCDILVMATNKYGAPRHFFKKFKLTTRMIYAEDF